MLLPCFLLFPVVCLPCFRHPRLHHSCLNLRHSVSFSYSPFPSPYEFFTFYLLPFSPLLPSLFSLTASVTFSFLYSLPFVSLPPSFIHHFLLPLFLPCVSFVSSSFHIFPVFILSFSLHLICALLPLLQVRTEGEAPSAAPTGVRADALSATSLRVSWDTPPPHTHHGDLLGYNVGVRRHE